MSAAPTPPALPAGLSIALSTTMPAALPTISRFQRVVLAACFWTAVGLVFVIPLLAQSANWRTTLWSSLAQWWSWGLLAPLITAVDRYLPFGNRQLLRRLLAHLVLGPLFTLVYAYLSAGVAAAMGLTAWSQTLDLKLLAGALHGMFWSMLVYGLIVGVWQAWSYQQRYVSAELRMERLERNFSEARLNGLRMQLDPHFLFNALNTISAQLEHEPKLARKMIEHLGDLLRLSLSSHSRQEIPLAEELAFLEPYLAIQKIRFGTSLRIEIQVAEAVRHALVPSMFIQPLVENAIRHGLAPRAGGGTVMLNVTCLDQQLHIRVSDDGVGLPPGWSLHTGAGLGLSVTRERIAGLYPAGASHFSIHARAAGGTEVAIHLPLRLMEAPHARHLA